MALAQLNMVLGSWVVGELMAEVAKSLLWVGDERVAVHSIIGAVGLSGKKGQLFKIIIAWPIYRLAMHIKSMGYIAYSPCSQG